PRGGVAAPRHGGGAEDAPHPRLDGPRRVRDGALRGAGHLRAAVVHAPNLTKLGHRFEPAASGRPRVGRTRMFWRAQPSFLAKAHTTRTGDVITLREKPRTTRVPPRSRLRAPASVVLPCSLVGATRGNVAVAMGGIELLAV